MSVAIELSDELLDVLADRVAERLAERPRWRDTEGLAAELGVPVRQVRLWREKGLPAKRVGRRLLFDLREVDRFLERQGEV